MSSSRESSPDWLRTFQAPTSTHLTLSSDSDSLLNGSDHSPRFTRSLKSGDTYHSENGAASRSSKKLKAKSPKSKQKEEHTPSRKKNAKNSTKSEGNANDEKVSMEVKSEEPSEPCAANHSMWALSSDSESLPESILKRDEKSSLSQLQENEEAKDPVLTGTSKKSPPNISSQGKSPKKPLKAGGQTSKKEIKDTDILKIEGDDEDTKIVAEESIEKQTEPQVTTSRLPLVLSEKVHRSKENARDQKGPTKFNQALIECEGDSIDLSGDMGAVGRVVIPDPSSEDREMYFDLKGTIYKTTIVPSRTFCVVSFGQSEAKIEAIMNDFIQLKPQSNVYESETMVEGTLDGYLFDSEDEAVKGPKANQADNIEEQTDEKTRGKSDKASVVTKKRGKAAGGKTQPPKKARKKTLASKKPRTKK